MGIKRIVFAGIVILTFAGMMTLPCVAPSEAFAAKSSSAQLSGWQSNKTCYYKNGVKVTGKQKIGKAYYYFNSKGKLKTGTTKAKGITYYCNSKGEMEAYKKGSAIYKPTGKKMAAYAAKEYKALLSAREQLKKIVSKGDSKSEQMYKCMKWVNKGYYQHYRDFSNLAGWTATYANDHFVKRLGGERLGDCVSDPCAFAYLCLAIGYTDVAVGVDAVYKNAHAVARINGKYYDPLFAEVKGFKKYYGYRSEHLQAVVKLKVPSCKNGYSTSSYSGKIPSGLNAKATDDSSSKSGLIEKGGALYYYDNGKKAKSKWVEIDGATYHFGKSGKAAVGSVKLKKNGKKSYYVFGKNGKLKTGKKTRVVKVNGVSYRVTAKGKAKGGWAGSGSSKRFYLENGAKATGPCLVKGNLYVFSSSGAYMSSATVQARKLMVREAPVGELVKLMGTPKSVKSAASCFILNKLDADGLMLSMEGTDRTYYYDHLKLSTFFANGADGDGVEYYMSAAAR